MIQEQPVRGMNDCKGIFAQTVFDLSNRVLSENKIKVLKKVLDFALIQRKINKPELHKDSEEFCRCMRTKWNFRNELSQDFSEVPAFACKSSWTPPLGQPNLEAFLSQVESELLKEIQDSLRYSNLSQEKWRAVRSLADNRSIVIKKADKGTCVVVSDIWDYIKEAEKQLGIVLFMRKSIIVKRFFLSWFTQVINTLKNLNSSCYISYKEMKYFTYEYKKACNLGRPFNEYFVHRQ